MTTRQDFGRDPASSRDDLDAVLRNWLRADAPDGIPATLNEAVIDRARRSSQRPAWLVGLRGNALGRAGGMAGPIARYGLQFAVLALLLALAGVIAAIGSQRHLPAPPTGLARNGQLAYDVGGRIVVSGQDGSNRKELSSGGGFATSPAWSPDGTKLAFWSQSAEGKPFSLLAVDADGKNPRTLTGPGGVAPATFVSDRWLWALQPEWSPDGSRLAFSVLVDGSPRIMVARADGGGSSVIGNPALQAETPTWSPDGTRIAFKGGRSGAVMAGFAGSGAPGVYVMKADGNDVRRLTTVGGNEQAFRLPRWSPDDRTLLFQAGGSYVYDLWSVGADGTGERRLTDAGQYGEWPTWSPDGRRIAWINVVPYDQGSVGWAGVSSHVMVMNADGSGRFALIHPQIDGSPLQWSPDGTLVLTGTGDRSSFDLVLIDSAGQDSATVVDAPNNVSGGSWQRLAP